MYMLYAKSGVMLLFVILGSKNHYEKLLLNGSSHHGNGQILIPGARIREKSRGFGPQIHLIENKIRGGFVASSFLLSTTFCVASW